MALNSSGKPTTKPKGPTPPKPPTTGGSKPPVPTTAPKAKTTGGLKPVNSAAQPARPATAALGQFHTLLKPSGYMLGGAASATGAKPKQPVVKRMRDMGTSAWGVEHLDEVSKKKDNRARTATVLGAVDSSGFAAGLHGAYHGKQGRKAAAGFSQGGKAALGGVVGALGGAAAGGVTRNPLIAQGTAVAGATAGSAYGSRRGFKTNKAKGRLRKV